MQMKMKLGIGLMALGVGVWAGWSAWTRTRRIEPVNVPVRLAAGQSIDLRFTLNYDGLYLIEIGPEKTGSTEAQLGTLSAEWTVSSGGQEVKRGNTAEAHSAPGDAEAARVIGEFNGRAGQTYELQVGFTTDAPEPWAGKARLKVGVSGLARENLQAESALVFSTMFICELFGIVLVGVGLWGRRTRASL